MKYATIFVAMLVISGCTTLQVRGKNETAYDLKLAVKVKDGKDPEQKYSNPVTAGTASNLETIGKYRSGTPIVVTLSLPTGGIVADAERTLPSNPDPYPIEISAKTIAAQPLDPTDAKTIERQLTDVANSCLSPAASVDSLIQSNIGGIYIFNGGDDPCNYTRLYDPTMLSSKATYDEMYPAKHPPSYQLILSTNEANSAKLQAQVPSTIALKTDFNASKLYKYVFLMENTTWAMTPKSWESVQRDLLKSAEGKAIVDKIKALMLSGKKISYLDQAFFMGHVTMDVYTAKTVGVDVKVSKDNVFDAGAAYNWSSARDDSKKYDNLVLRVRYAPLVILEPVTIKTKSDKSFMTIDKYTEAPKAELFGKDPKDIKANVTDKYAVISTPYAFEKDAINTKMPDRKK